MRVLSSIALAALVLLGVFAALNWGVLTAPTTLSFGLFSLEASLGLILLAFALGFAFVLLGYMTTQRTTRYMEARHHAQELKAQREIAEQVEASRLQELRLQLEREMAALRTTMEESANGLAASIGEVDDKLDRVLRLPATVGTRSEDG